jgi:Ras-related protein Rab-8A
MFPTNFISTIGLDYRITTVTIDEQRFTVLVWDTAGQERFQSITPSFYRQASGILLVYDVTDALSFQNCQEWFHEAKTEASNKKIHVVLVGNKIDCGSKARQVSTVDGQRLADMFGLSFMETSAKENVNVAATFDLLLRLVVSDRQPVVAAGKARDGDIEGKEDLAGAVVVELTGEGGGQGGNRRKLLGGCC